MPKHYTIRVAAISGGIVTLELAFAAPGHNTEILHDALAELDALKLTGGKGIRFNGPASLPVAMALAHKVAHLFGFVACFDPKLERYVVAISHDPEYTPGDLIV